MYIHAGNETTVRSDKIVAVFDCDSATMSDSTMEFLRRAEKEKRLVTVAEDMPKAFILMKDGTVYLTQLSAATLLGRMSRDSEN